MPPAQQPVTSNFSRKQWVIGGLIGFMVLLLLSILLRVRHTPKADYTFTTNPTLNYAQAPVADKTGVVYYSSTCLARYVSNPATAKCLGRAWTNQTVLSITPGKDGVVVESAPDATALQGGNENSSAYWYQPYSGGDPRRLDQDSLSGILGVAYDETSNRFVCLGYVSGGEEDSYPTIADLLTGQAITSLPSDVYNYLYAAGSKSVILGNANGGYQVVDYTGKKIGSQFSSMYQPVSSATEAVFLNPTTAKAGEKEGSDEALDGVGDLNRLNLTTGQVSRIEAGFRGSYRYNWGAMQWSVTSIAQSGSKQGLVVTARGSLEPGQSTWKFGWPSGAPTFLSVNSDQVIASDQNRLYVKQGNAQVPTMTENSKNFQDTLPNVTLNYSSGILTVTYNDALSQDLNSVIEQSLSSHNVNGALVTTKIVRQASGY